MMEFKVGNNKGKGEHAGYYHFLLYTYRFLLFTIIVFYPIKEDIINILRQFGMFYAIFFLFV